MERQRKAFTSMLGLSISVEMKGRLAGGFAQLSHPATQTGLYALSRSTTSLNILRSLSQGAFFCPFQTSPGESHMVGMENRKMRVSNSFSYPFCHFCSKKLGVFSLQLSSLLSSFLSNANGHDKSFLFFPSTYAFAFHSICPNPGQARKIHSFHLTLQQGLELSHTFQRENPGHSVIETTMHSSHKVVCPFISSFIQQILTM